MDFLSTRRSLACRSAYAIAAALLCLHVGTKTARADEGWTVPAAAEEPTGDLTLERAVSAALRRNPTLMAADYEVRAADARIAQARLRPNPEIAADLGSSAIGRSGAESTLTLSQVLELGGKRARRTEVATVDRELADVERQAQQLDVLAEVARRFIMVVATQDRVSLAGDARNLTQKTLDAISARVTAARSPEAERSRARIALTRAQIEEQQAQSQLQTARLSLAALWGSPEPAFTRARADLLTLDAVKSFEGLVADLARNPDFLRFASQGRLRDAELRLARAQARPNLTLGAGLQRAGEGGGTFPMIGFSMALPLFNQNQGAIREAEVRRGQTEVQRQAAFLRARATVYALYQELSATRIRVGTLRSEALPQAQQALEQTQYGYERGRFSYLELATAQQDLLGVRAAVIEAAADYHRVLTEVERLTGESLAADSALPDQRASPELSPELP